MNKLLRAQAVKMIEEMEAVEASEVVLETEMEVTDVVVSVIEEVVKEEGDSETEGDSEAVTEADQEMMVVAGTVDPEFHESYDMNG